MTALPEAQRRAILETLEVLLADRDRLARRFLPSTSPPPVEGRLSWDDVQLAVHDRDRLDLLDDATLQCMNRDVAALILLAIQLRRTPSPPWDGAFATVWAARGLDRAWAEPDWDDLLGTRPEAGERSRREELVGTLEEPRAGEGTAPQEQVGTWEDLPARWWASPQRQACCERLLAYVEEPGELPGLLEQALGEVFRAPSRRRPTTVEEMGRVVFEAACRQLCRQHAVPLLRWAALAPLLALLSSEQRTVLTRHLYDGEGIPDVAQGLGLTPEEAWRLCHEALLELVGHMTADWFVGRGP